MASFMFPWIFFGSCKYGSFSDIGLMGRSSNSLLIVLRNVSSNVTSAGTSLSLIGKSGILNIQFMMTVSGAICTSLAHSRLQYWRVVSNLAFLFEINFLNHHTFYISFLVSFSQLLCLLTSLFIPPSNPPFILELYSFKECLFWFIWYPLSIY